MCAMKPQDDAITGGTVLRIAAIQSPNFVAGSSGWIIRLDGSAEFNNGTFRGSIEVGPDPGKHFIVNNPATGDVVDIYNVSNQLVFSIDGFGRATSYDLVNNIQAQITGAGYFFNGPNSTGGETGLFPAGAVGTTHVSDVSVIATNGANNSGQLAVISQNDGHTLDSTVKALERGVFGSVVVSDNQSVNNLFHSDVYTVNTNANGDATFNHNCSFTPNTGFLVGLQNASHNPFYQYAWYSNAFTSTTAKVNLRNLDGTVYANITGASLMGVFYG